jgi:N-acyl-L-homoserine lactone synthetase
MIALVDTHIGKDWDSVLRGMFVARREVFVDLLRWDLPVLDGRFEIDQFDNECAQYVVLTDGELRHLGSARLLPTTRPHILGSIFPDLCEGPVPTGAHIYEITRFCLDRRLRAPERRQVRDRLVSALVQHALVHGIASYTGVAEVAWLKQILRFGWDARQLGMEMHIEGCRLAALQINITPETPNLLASVGIWAPPAPAPGRAMAPIVN